MNKTSKNANGAGSTPTLRADGRWSANYHFLDEYGVKHRSSVYAKTKKDCQKKLNAKLAELDKLGGVQKSTKGQKKYTVESWLTEWVDTYCTELKPSTIAGYRSKCRVNICPYLGDQPLESLTNVRVQKFINALKDGDKDHKPLSPKSIQNVHGILHRGLEQAVIAGLLQSNPCDHVSLPKVGRAELKPLMDDDVVKFLQAIQGNFYEPLFILALFSGMRQGELVGLRWDNVDLDAGYITVCEQIQKVHDGPGFIHIDSTKNGSTRTAAIAPSVVKVLLHHRARQAEWRLAAGPAWEESGLVFTDELGHHVSNTTIQHTFKRIVRSIGLPDCRFHDLRHSYAINALQAGDTVKDVQEQLGHFSSAFTLDVYVTRSETMKKASQDRMERFFQDVAPDKSKGAAG